MTRLLEQLRLHAGTFYSEEGALDAMPVASARAAGHVHRCCATPLLANKMVVVANKAV
jgi:hypothetical protein